MKAIILAAGKGKRFGEITKSIPKPLIKFGEFCLIEHNIFLLKKYGYTDIVINVSHLKDKIINYLGDGKKYGISIQYSIEEPEPLETGGGIKNALKLLGDQPFLTLNSDIYTDFDLSNLQLKGGDLASIVMVKNPDHNKDGDFSLKNGRVRLDKEKNLTYSGIAILHHEIFKNYTSLKFKLVDVFLEKIKSDKISGFQHKGIWYDIGNAERLKLVEKLFPNN